MKTEWDYTELADAYLKRPDYAKDAIDQIFLISGVGRGDAVCDVGAGVAHLTLELARRELNVSAVEPNDAMRRNGIKRTEEFLNVRWFEGTGEQTGQSENSFKLVTFGSSFNVCDRQQALKETHRILVPGGYFVCLWNHRDLEDPLQKKIEECICRRIEGYSYGTRREDQTQVIEASGLFESVSKISGKIMHRITKDDAIEAWRSHGTLQRQAGDEFLFIVDEIAKLINEQDGDTILVPYDTHGWIARAIQQ